MISRQSLRYFNLKVPFWSPINKTDLAKLRKKTGYTFANCKKALEVNNNDISLAEKWLKEQAQALGWAKATKLEGRATLQGLIGVIQKGGTAAIVEINCETDFVARNRKFLSFVELTTQTCLSEALQINTSGGLTKRQLTSSDLKELVADDKKSLADHSALTISSVGENLSLRRAMFLKSSQNIHIAGLTHPPQYNISPPTLTGRYGALLAYKSNLQNPEVLHIARQLCQHVVGMNPSKVGVVGIDEEIENKDEETVMIHQEFLLDPTVTVGQLTKDLGIEIVDFVRYECGENLSNEENSVDLKAASSCSS